MIILFTGLQNTLNEMLLEKKTRCGKNIPTFCKFIEVKQAKRLCLQGKFPLPKIMVRKTVV